MKKDRLFHKKAQGGLNAAILVAIISVLIIAYILFLPTEERRELLEEKKTSVSSRESTNEEEIVLLSEGIGRLDPAQRIEDKTLPNVNIFETTNSKILARINPIYVRNGWFDKKTKIVEFKIDDLENTDNVLLSFSAPKRKGILTIKLNGQVIYEYSITSVNVEPIRLDKRLLKEDNILEFSVSSVGIKFWKTNEYSLDNVKILGDITDLSKQESKNIFTLTSTEYQNLEKAEIRFIPYCTAERSVGILDLFINNRNIFSSVPVCGDLYRQEIPIGILREGQNKVIFRTNKGSYSIEQVKLIFDSKDIITNAYYFTINDTLYSEILDTGDDKYDLFLKIKFVDDGKTKKADIKVNGANLPRIDQDRADYSKKIDNYIEEGNNVIELKPLTVLNIITLEAVAEKK